MGVFKGKAKDYLFFYGKEIKDFKNIYFMGGELLLVKVINHTLCALGDSKEKPMLITLLKVEDELYLTHKEA